MGEIQAIVDRLAKSDAGFKATVKTLLAREPFEVAPEAGIVRSLADAAAKVLGKRPRLFGDTPWMDSALLAAAGVETVKGWLEQYMLAGEPNASATAQAIVDYLGGHNRFLSHARRVDVHTGEVAALL